MFDPSVLGMSRWECREGAGPRCLAGRMGDVGERLLLCFGTCCSIISFPEYEMEIQYGLRVFRLSAAIVRPHTVLRSRQRIPNVDNANSTSGAMSA